MVRTEVTHERAGPDDARRGPRTTDRPRLLLAESTPSTVDQSDSAGARDAMMTTPEPDLTLTWKLCYRHVEVT